MPHGDISGLGQDGEGNTYYYHRKDGNGKPMIASTISLFKIHGFDT